MSSLFQALRHRLLGGSDASLPIFDNALKGNELLQRAEVIADLKQPGDLATDSEHIYVADGTTVLRLGHGSELSLAYETGRTVTALACIAGGVACALDGREIRVFGGRLEGRRVSEVEGRPFLAVNAIWAEGSTLIATDGSGSRGCAEWRHDLMECGRSGAILEVDMDGGGARILASGLRYAFGAARFGGDTLVSETWAHRLVAVERSGARRVVLDNLPAYPSRLAVASDGFWLTMFCVRTELVEFVLRDPSYCRRMVAGIDPDLWISPQLRTHANLQEPMQWGAMKQSGTIKPWAPARSYGLVVKLDRHCHPVRSFHSRTGGRFHGIVAAAERSDGLYLLSKGDNVLLRLDPFSIQGLAP